MFCAREKRERELLFLNQNFKIRLAANYSQNYLLFITENEAMGLSKACSSLSPLLSNNVKVLALDSTLQQCMLNFKELLSDYEQLQIECENNKMQILALKNKCDSKTCTAAEELEKEIDTKNQILQSVASSLTKLNDTKDWNVLTEAFKIIFGDTSQERPASKTSPTQPQAPTNSVEVKLDTNPSKDTSDVSLKEESLCEIEGTPTGRTSPIIQTKKTKSLLGKSSDFRDKKKCSEEWPTSESKSLKLTFSTPSRSKATKLRQSRLNLVKLKQTSVVDLTCSPEFSAGRNGETVMPLIKKESIENDDTILPSPTSGPTSFAILKTTCKGSPSKFKKPLSLKVKSEKCENEPKNDENKNIHTDLTNVGMEDSINILNPLAKKFNDIKKEKVSIKVEDAKQVPMDEDTTRCEGNSSISLLDQVNKLEQVYKSPAKRPLADNINIMNTPPKDAESSMSILHPDNRIGVENVKRKLPELVEPIYKEPTVRNKQEKRNLQGWSCEQCKNFYGELYKNDPVMLAKKINDCSKHRGKHNPERPKTPPNFWNPRWHVPEDTEELNRMNNAN